MFQLNLLVQTFRFYSHMYMKVSLNFKSPPAQPLLSFVSPWQISPSAACILQCHV